MAKKITKPSVQRVKRVLSKLGLREPRYFLENVDGWVVGNIVSPSFKGKDDLQRLKLIWHALEAEFGAEARRIGMLLAYTPDEWELDPVETVTPVKRRKKTGKAA